VQTGSDANAPNRLLACSELGPTSHGVRRAAKPERLLREKSDAEVHGCPDLAACILRQTGGKGVKQTAENDFAPLAEYT